MAAERLVPIQINNLRQLVSNSGGPDDRLGVDVVMSDVAINGGDEFGHAGEDASAQAVLGDVAEEAFHHAPAGNPSPAREGAVGLRLPASLTR